MADLTGSSLSDGASFLRRLEAARIHYTLTSVREGAVMVRVAVPGERWEIEFFAHCPPEIEVFRSNGGIKGADLLERLFKEQVDDDSASV